MTARPGAAGGSTRPPILLSALGLTKSYGARAPVVAGVDFEVLERTFTTLLGPSGCGKTTILRMIGGFEKPTAGTITLDGVPLGNQPPERRPVNTVFQSYALFPHMTVFDNVAFSLSLRSGSGDVAAKVRRALDAVHMSTFEDRYPAQLSGGQQQRVAVARAIVAKPRLLLLDEPLSALDRKMRGHLQVELKDLQRRLGIAFVYVTHDQEEAFALSDTILVMNEGRIVQSGAPETVYRRPANAFVADFIGGATLVPGHVDPSRRGPGHHPHGPRDLRGAPPSSPRPRDAGHAGPSARTASWSRAAAPPFPATVRHVTFAGQSYAVEADAQGVAIRFAASTPPSVGGTVLLSVRGEKAFVTGAA